MDFILAFGGLIGFEILHPSDTQPLPRRELKLMKTVCRNYQVFDILYILVTVPAYARLLTLRIDPICLSSFSGMAGVLFGGGQLGT